MKNLIKNPLFWITVILIVFVVVTVFIHDEEAFVGEEDVVDENIAIRINETTYTIDAFNNMLNGVNQELQMQGVEETKEELKDRTIEAMTQEALLIEYATDKGIEVTQEEIDEQFEQAMMMSGVENEEEFLSQIEMQQGIEGRDAIDDILKSDITINKLIELYEEEVEVTDEELQQTYDQYVQQMEQFEGVEGMEQEILSYEDAEGEMVDSLVQEKIYTLIISKIEEMEEDADIEIFIEDEDLELEEVSMPDMPQIDPEEMEIEVEDVE